MAQEQRKTTVLIPTSIDFQLYYAYDYDGGKKIFDYLQLVRSRGLFKFSDAAQREEEYWENLEKNRTKFVNGIDDTFDLLVDPPSNSGYHRPYLSAFLRKYKYNLPCVRFIKDTPVRSCPENLSALRANIRIMDTNLEPLEKYENVLVVDDVFSSGTIMTVVLEKLFEAGLSTSANFTLACPLRMPPKAVVDAKDVEVAAKGEESP